MNDKMTAEQAFQELLTLIRVPDGDTDRADVLIDAVQAGLEQAHYNNQALYEDLTEAFIGYQYRLDNPMPSATETKAIMILKYRSDPLFNAKVKSLVSGVMQVVSKHQGSQK